MRSSASQIPEYLLHVVVLRSAAEEVGHDYRGMGIYGEKPRTGAPSDEEEPLV